MKFEYIDKHVHLDGVKLKGVTDFTLNVNTNGEMANTVSIDMFVEVEDLKDILIEKSEKD